MGDIARHRNIFLNTRDALPPALLDRVGVKRDDLTYLEMGNFLTDVSQFRDPVWYILAKRTIWQERILAGTSPYATPIRLALAALGGVGALVAAKAGKSGIAAASALAGLVGLLGITPEQLASLLDLDDWLDKMLGVPLKGPKGRRRTHAEYGYVGEFFRHFTDGVTQAIFSNGAGSSRQVGIWTQITALSETEVDGVYTRFFTQYYPHEHTDQPPYVWDASRRPGVKKWYGTSRRQQTLTSQSGIMTAVDDGYIPYLADALTKLEADWRAFKPNDMDARRTALIRLGKILHGVEDWFFHSNVVELNRLVAFRPAKTEAETDEQFVRRFVEKGLLKEEFYIRGDNVERTPKPTLEERQIEFKRRLYRRLRFPIYEPGTKAASGGTPSKKPSTLSITLAYPAFPSQQDTAHTLLGALENLEGKFHRKEGQPRGTLPDGVGCALQKFITETPGGRALYKEKAKARGIVVPDKVEKPEDLLPFVQSVDKTKAELVGFDVLREWMPLVLTLLHGSERDRLAANVPAELWPLADGATAPKQDEGKEVTLQQDRHAKALKPTKQHDGSVESNYRHGMRLFRECGMIGARARAALDRAFDVDWESEKLNSLAPGAGGILISFAAKLHLERTENIKKITEFNKKSMIYDDTTDSGANDEIVGSHSLMSKDTVDASPFFNDAHVLACVASQTVAHILMDEVSSPASGTVVDWLKVLRYLIRFPEEKPGWELHALKFFSDNAKVPRVADLAELVALRQGARLPPAAAASRHDEAVKRGVDAAGLEEEYIRLEQVVQNYRST